MTKSLCTIGDALSLWPSLLFVLLPEAKKSCSDAFWENNCKNVLAHGTDKYIHKLTKMP